jgi:nitroimidazol reductase NimA-like FMN-containing flavoprotein (pyridoxamine 5'-phosphate oxidase superfamily)
MNFGYSDKVFYLHSSREGRKIDILKQNDKVALFFTSETQLFHRDFQVACSWRMRYKSVQVIGNASFLENFDEKIAALKIFMKTYNEYDFKFSKPAVDNIAIIKVTTKQWTARTFEY